MADFLSDLASDAGVEDEQAHHGVGALLALVKSRLSPEAYAHLKNAIPDAEGMLAAFQDKAGAAGGALVEAVKGMAGKVLARQGTSSVEDHFAGAGLSADQLRNLLPRLHDMLAGKIPPHVLDQIKQHVPGFGPAAAQAGKE
jgi:hypothetical protein